jgi:nucleoside-diphosphate-sugar epimerase
MLGQVDGLRYVICRFGTVFGPTPGMRFHTAVNRFCFQAAIGYPITVWKTALNQNRPYLCMTDMVRGIEFIIKNQIFTNEIYNLVTVNTTVGHIVNIIKESIPDLLINYVDSEIMSQLSYTISSKKFLDLGFEFQGDIAKGIKDTLSLFQ